MHGKINIGLVGLAGSGKDTSADFLCSDHAYSRASFAAPLKEICYNLGWDLKKDERGRKLLQDVGMAFRSYDDLTWVKYMAKTLNPSIKYVFTDVRFENEAEFIRNNGGIIIRIVRPELALQNMHLHVSESGQASITADHTIVNDSNLENLHKQLTKIVESYDKSKVY